MKIFTINPHGDEVNDKVTITRGVQLSSFVLHDKPTKGIDLGYFQKDLDPANPVRKYFRVYMTHGSDFVTDVKPYYVDGNFKSLTAIPEEDDDNTSACVFLNCDKPYGRARFFKEAEYGRKKILVNGKLVGDKEIVAKDGHTFRDECHPAILLVSAGEKYEISYFNSSKKCKQSAELTFDGVNISVTVSTIPFKKKVTPSQPSESLLSSIREATFDFDDYKHDRRSRKSNKWERNRKEDRWR